MVSQQHIGALEFLRSRGVRSFLDAALAHLNARWQLRRATRVGSARLWGRASVANHGGTMIIGDRVRMSARSVRIDLSVGRGATLEIGEGTFINYGADISALRSVRLGRDCLLGQYALVIDSNYHDVGDRTQPDVPQPVVIEDHVWLGARVVVLPGSHIGEGAIIGAQSVVTGTIPPRVFAAGNPAKVIRSLD